MDLSIKQPASLWALFQTEMWERFAFYGIQGMLVLYLTQGLAFSDSHAYAITGQFTALAFILPVLGGWVADRILGLRFSILIGGFFECIGCTLIAINSHTLMTGLAFIVIGAGFFKPCVSSFLGRFYGVDDPRREAGFTLFYVGICIGISVSLVLAGYIQACFGWLVFFGTASLAMLAGLITFRRYYRYYEHKGLPPHSPLVSVRAFLMRRIQAILGVAVVAGLAIPLMLFPTIGKYGLYVIGLIFYAYIIGQMRHYDAITRRRLTALLILLLISAVFWALLFQMFFVTNLFTVRAVDRVFFGHHIPAAVFLSIESTFIIVFGPLLARIWLKNKQRFSIPYKFAFALLLMGISMQILACIIPTGASLSPALWLVLVYAIVAAGDLLLSPIGLSMMTQYAPPQLQALMMGGWLMSMGFGGTLTGLLAKCASIPPGITDLTYLNHVYQHAFQLYAWLGFLMFVVSALIAPLIKKYLH